jgi:DNA repair protein RadC
VENIMNAQPFTAVESAIVDRAETWIPKNVRDLARVDPKKARDLLSEMQAELLACEGIGDVCIDPEEFAPFFHAVIGKRATEQFAYVMLDQGRKVLAKGVFKGCGTSVTRCTLYPREVFTLALKIGATGIVLAHNHPGGTCLPSPQDRELTRRIADIGEGLEVRILDHLIVTPQGEHIAFRKNGWM